MKHLGVFWNLFKRPFSATKMLWKHRRTVWFLLRKKEYRKLYNFVFTIYFIRGEDCGKGCLDFLFKLFGRAPCLWDIEIEITTKCYLRCIHCEHTHWEDKTYLNQDLSFADFAELIDSIPKLKWINMTGEGSAFLNPDFILMVEYAKSKGIYVDFSHDFYKLEEENMRRLIEAKVDRIYWSLDGVTRSTYEKIRVGSNLQEVVNNVRDFIHLKKEYKSPIPEVCFRFCFFKDNIHEVEMLPDFLNWVALGFVELYGDEPSINMVALLEFTETSDKVCEIDPVVVEEFNRRSKKLGFTVYWSHITHVESEKPPLSWCTFWSEPYRMIDGSIVPCCGVLMSNSRPFLERKAFGNTKKMSLKEIWNLPRYKNFRKTIVNPRKPVPEICLGCRVFKTYDRADRHGVSK